MIASDGYQRRISVITRDVVVDGIRIHLAEAGAGPGLLLLHGLSATHRNWEHTIPAFADRWHVVAPDLPGHGESAKPDAPYTINFYAGMMRSLGRELGFRDAVVIGNSLGGQIAVELALTYPSWTRAVVLAAPAGGFGPGAGAFGWVIGAVAGPRLLRLALPLALDRCVSDPSSPACEERRRILAERLRHDDYPSFARAVNRSLVGALAARHQPLHRLTQPALLIWGRDDRLLALSGSRRVLREVPHARLAVLDGCGHLPMVEQPEEFNRVVAEFLSAAEAAALPPARRPGGIA
jgi:pimeloyl-ACP methyl ester carboxylesterase